MTHIVNELLNIKKDIAKHNDTNMYHLVEQRLNKTFNIYVQQLEHSYNRLLQIEELKVLKAYARGVEND